MKFEEINKNNIKTYLKLSKSIFDEDDYKHIKDISHGYVNQTKEFININKIDNCDRILYFIIKNENKNIGITGLYSFSNSTAWIGWFGLHKSFRGKGLGRKSLLKTIEIAKNLNYNKLNVWTDENAKEALNLYKSEGFVVVPSLDYPILLEKHI